MVKKGLVPKTGFKRNNKGKTFTKSKNTKKQRIVNDEKLNRSPSLSNESGENTDTSSEEEGAKEVIYKEPTVFHDLLKALGSRNESVADALRKRQREGEGRSDTEEDENADPESSSFDEQDDDLEISLNHVVVKGLDTPGVNLDAFNSFISTLQSQTALCDDNESPKSPAVRNGSGGLKSNGGVEPSVNVESDDDQLSDTDDEDDLKMTGESTSEASVSTSSLDNHLGYKLSKEEIDILLRRKCKYTWKMPALNVPNCNWRGTGACFTEDSDKHFYQNLKPKLYKHWLEIYETSKRVEFSESRQRSFFSICNSYRDIMHHNKKPFYLKGLEEDSSVMDAYLMHSLNHIFRSRDLMIKNDRKLARNQEDMEEMRDRGFTRPKVLVLLPLAGIARRVVKRLIQLTPSKNKVNVENVQRFNDEFGTGSTEEDKEDDVENFKSKKSSKPPDYQALLERDNNNDHFMIGVKFTQRSIKLYSDFYTSDMIVASPLGLITKIGAAEVDKEKDVDYLSSIEILIIDHADVMVMQNWSHVNTVVEQLNQMPSKQHGTDIMRIRPWYFDGQARFYRQTIILGSHINPDINALFNHHCINYQGKINLECEFKGVLPKILLQVHQIYQRFAVESIAEADDARLEYFSKKVFPKIKDSVQSGVMIFVSSYFEYVRLRNFLKSQAASFCLFGEYIKRNDISRVRGQFFRGEKKIILYTERAHFYYRYKIRGVQKLIIYSLPERKEFYPEIVNLLEESDNTACTVLFSRLDHFRLERIVGSAAAKRMLDSDKGIFVFA